MNTVYDSNTPGSVAIFWSHFKSRPIAVIGLGIVSLAFFIAIFAPFIAPHDPISQHEGFYLTPPSWHEAGTPQFLLGTDDLGRDIFSRLIYGTRISIGIGSIIIALSLIAALIIGAIAASTGLMLKTMIVRTLDLMTALPSILVATVIVAVIGPGLNHAILAVTIVIIPHLAKVIHEFFEQELSKDYVLAAKLDGMTHVGVLFKSILPNMANVLIVQTSLAFSTAILEITALGFLGLGAQPPLPEWGSLLFEAKDYIFHAAWTVTIPGITILITVMSINLVGDGLHHALTSR